MSARLLIPFLLFTLSLMSFCEGRPKNDKKEPVLLMALEVQLDGVTLSKTAFPVCHAERGATVEEPQKALSFSFKPKHAIAWMSGSGITVTPIKTKPNQPIEASVQIWQARADHDWLTIGLSFYSDDGILMNAIHIAHLKRRDRTEIAAGLVVLTCPAKRGK